MASKSAPEGQDLYAFSYGDGFNAGVSITEKLVVDKHGGRFVYSRTSDSKHGGGRTGSAWVTNQVTGVRFATKLGDPSHEGMTLGQRQVARKRGLVAWMASTMPVFLSILTMIFNPLTFSLVLAVGLSIAVWQIFPRIGDRYDMSQGPDSPAIAWSACLAVITGLSVLLSGWWTQSVRCRCCRSSLADRDFIICKRLDLSVATKWRGQRNFTGGFLLLFLAWCIFVLVACPVAYGASRKTECTDGGCVKLAAGDPEPTCGVGSCSCGGLADLSCVSADQAKDLSICRNIQQPLCASPGNSTSASGMHVVLLLVAFGTSAMTFFLFLFWLLAEASMAHSWLIGAPVTSTDERSVMYHRFQITFRSRTEPKLVFCLGADDDPQVVAASLMPSDPGAAAARLAHSSSLALTQSALQAYQPGATGYSYDPGSTGVPTIFDSQAEDEVLEPQWC
mmetsp:Transcript_48458/g.87070  ORF Transcript_48458/g.87070 Transcript_48458/m.87070 type:complete len:449 (-) Transcript_48458:35-1381(-)